MTRLALGAVAGPVYAVLSAATTVPLSFAEKRAALLAAFLDRFAIGVVMACSDRQRFIML